MFPQLRKEGKDKVIPIVNVVKGSPADKAGIRTGDRLESIGSVKIRDVLDYQFYATDENCSVTVV
ncbi:MAG: PDZ domain-containing protein, partial [Clostridia bacterium]|nr:PDZ domain-containing protein [Clostridia bacterium]